MLTPWLEDPDVTLYHGDCLDVLASLPDRGADAVVTSPPYLDMRPEYETASLATLEVVFLHLRRVAAGGPLLLNLGRVWRNGIESRWWHEVIESAEQVGYQLLDTLVWVKPNANPIHGNVFANSHEYVFVLGDPGVELNVDDVRRPHSDETRKRFGRAWTNHRGVKNPRPGRERKMRAEPNPLGARPRSYIEVCVGKEKGNPHPAPMAADLAEHLVRLGCAEGGVVLDPFAGSGTTLLAARKHGRRSIGVDLNEEYLRIAADRLGQQSLLFEAAS